MTRRRDTQLLLGQVVLFGMAMPNPKELMDPELQRLDVILEDDELVDAVVARMRKRRPQSGKRGRSSTAAEVVLRLLVLKHLRNWSYERLQWEVTGNVAYREFCRVGAGKVPDSTTMVRYGKLLDASVLQPIFDRLVQTAVEKKVTRARKMRVDTTVVEEPIHYPTDSSLCEDGIRVLARELERLLKAGVELPFKIRKAARAVGRRVHEIGQALRLRGDKTREALKRPYRGLLRITARLVRQAEAAIEIGTAKLNDLEGNARGQAARTLSKLKTMAPRVRQVVRQTRARVFRGITDSKNKLISIFQPAARILRRGKLHKPTEFGQLVIVQEAEGGVTTDVRVTDAKHDSELLEDAVRRHAQVTGRTPDLVAADRGFHSSAGIRAAENLGVRQVAIPKPGKKSKRQTELERKRSFRTARAWRAGGEARISRLKHTFGMHRTRYRGEDAVERAALWAGISNNLVAIARG